MTKGKALSETFLDFLGGKCKELLLLPLCTLLFKGQYVLVTPVPLCFPVLAMGLCYLFDAQPLKVS